MYFGMPVKFGSGVIALGDSMTLANGATNSSYGYVQLFQSRDVGGTLNNQAVSGSGITTSAQWALGSYYSLYTRNSVAAVMIGFNDILRYSSASTYDKIESGYRSLVASLLGLYSLPASLLTKTGTWQAAPEVGRAQAFSGTGLSGSGTLSYQFSGEALVIGSFIRSDNSYKDITITVDGTATDFLSVGTDEASSPSAKVLLNLGAGPHTAVISAKTPGTTIMVDYVGTLAKPYSHGSIIVMKIPGMTNWSYNGNTINQSILDQANYHISKVISEFADFPIALVDTPSYYTPDSAHTSPDGQHPSDAGYAQLYKGLLSNAGVMY